MEIQKRVLKSSASVWLIISMTVILTIVVVIMAVVNYKRETGHVERMLSEKGLALIKSFEVGARIGMMGGLDSERRIQTLIRETSDLPDIQFIALTNEAGLIVAHSDPAMVGKQFLPASELNVFFPTPTGKWIALEKTHIPSSFMVYKIFTTVGDTGSQRMNEMMGRMMRSCEPPSQSNDQHPPMMGAMRQSTGEFGNPIIFIGMDAAPYNEAQKDDTKAMITLSAVLLLLAVGSMVSLIWVEAYKRSSRKLRDSRVIATEIISNLPVGMVVVSPDGLITHLNEEAGTLLGASPSESIHNHVNEVLPKSIQLLLKSGEIANKGSLHRKEKNAR